MICGWLLKYNVCKSMLLSCSTSISPMVITHAMHIFRLAIQPTDETDVGCGSGIECWALGLIITGVVVLLLIPVTIIIGFCVFRQRRKKSAKLG